MNNLTTTKIQNTLSSYNTSTRSILNGVPFNYDATNGVFIISSHYTFNTNISAPTELAYNGKFYLPFYDAVNYLTAITEAREAGAAF